MPLSGTVYPARHQEDIPFSGVDFISFVSNETWGKPAIIAPGTDDFASAEAQGGEVTVLYVNPANIVALEAIKTP